jgi:rubredoxin
LVVGLTLAVGAVAAASGSVGATTEPGDDMTDDTEMTDDTTAAVDTSAGTTEAGGGGAVVQCGFAPSETTGGDLAGFAGTTPYGEITEDFITEICEVDPNLDNFADSRRVK